MGNICADGTKNATVEKVILEQSQTKEPEARLAEPVVEESGKEPQLAITIIGARGVRHLEWLPQVGKPDCYCEVKTGNLLLCKTENVATNMVEPVWNETSKVDEIANGSPLSFVVYEKDFIGSEKLGEVLMTAKEYATEGFNGELKLQNARTPQASIRLKVKVANKPLPAFHPTQVQVTVQKPSADVSFGLDLDTQDGATLHVLEVKDGPFMEYNSLTSKPELQVKTGDVITSVNGVQGATDKMLAKFRENLQVDCVVKRTVTTTIIFDRGASNSKGDNPLGLQYPPEVQGEVLVIKNIGEGAAKQHNMNAKPADKLFVGDRIISIGNTSRNALELQSKLDSLEGKVQITLSRIAEQPETESSKGFVHWFYS
mmetsp:Transcript_9622/g.28933  ORF Transcript_9622/g.28933 Transcript_9622/m.28933 type:complete len:372 (-) Transcript_9622:137-1252(-)